MELGEEAYKRKGKEKLQQQKRSSTPKGSDGVYSPGEAARLQPEMEKLRKRAVAATGYVGDEPQVKSLERKASKLALGKNIRSGGGDGSKGKSPMSPASPLFSKRKAGEVRAEVPEYFLCPLSSEIMRDPVILDSGETFDRPFIEAWLKAGNRTCPLTEHVLSHTFPIPNLLVQRMISEWCNSQGVSLPPYEGSPGIPITKADRAKLDDLLKKISSSSIPAQKQGAKDLRQLTKSSDFFRALFGEEPGAVSLLASLLSSPGLDQHPEFQENVVTTIFNLSISESNKKIVGDDPKVIPLLIDALKTGTMESRGNAAAALFNLSAIDDNKLKIGRLDTMKPLLELLEQGSPMARKDAAAAIFSLCNARENIGRAVKEGAVRVLLKSITELALVEESLTILSFLVGNKQGLEDMAESDGGVECMLGIIRGSTCARSQENAAVVLYAICTHDRTKLREVEEEEEFTGRISWLAQNGTSRARRKAAGLLDRLERSRATSSPTSASSKGKLPIDG